MSTLKLSTTASLYVRSATTKSKTKPSSFISFSSTPYKNNIHQNKFIVPSTNKFPISNNKTPPSLSHNLGFSPRTLVSNLPPQPQQEQPEEPSKLLTLPTILTLGRVAAVPLLVASTFFLLMLQFHIHFFIFILLIN